MISNHLIVTGCPRTGTTALCVLLSKDPRILVTNEVNTYFNWKNPMGDFLSRFLVDPTTVNRTLLETSNVSPEEVARLALEQNMDGEHLYNTLKEKSNKPIIGDKVPVGYLLKLYQLSQEFPDAKFIITIRDGRDVIASQIRHYAEDSVRQHWHKSNIKEAEEMWLRLMRVLANQVSMVDPSKIFILRYEYLLDDTEYTLKSLSEFMGLDDPVENNNTFKSVHRDAWKEELPDMMDKLSIEFKTYLTLLGYR